MRTSSSYKTITQQTTKTTKNSSKNTTLTAAIAGLVLVSETVLRLEAVLGLTEVDAGLEREDVLTEAL